MEYSKGLLDLNAGKIFVKKSDDDRKTRISTMDDLAKLGLKIEGLVTRVPDV
ncbi:hypothetical protein J6590_073937 [Homalodisca vitripennis]|nr:hypothetical protein J6590_073937 [Homalodisca vitripennis]